MPTYICQEGDSNKFWSYEIDGENSVTFRWGRLGLDGQSSCKSFNNERAMQTAINKKVSEKIRKGYFLSSDKEKKKEEDKANKLGFRNKIMRVQYVRKGASKLSFLNDYDSKQHILVEVKDSWDKSTVRLVLSKTDCHRIESVAEADRQVFFDTIRPDNSSLAKNVRNVLKELLRTVQEVVKRRVTMGARRLMLDDEATVNDTDETGNTEFEDTYNEIVSSSGATVSRQVVRKFAALGARKLDL